MNSFSERQLVCILKGLLSKSTEVKEAWAHKNIWQRLERLRREWSGEDLPEAFRWPNVFSHEVDLLVLNNQDELFCIEVKFFREICKNGKPKLPYYSGLGQAMALTDHGFSAVFLWHFFIV